jgi:hypothetical protein
MLDTLKNKIIQNEPKENLIRVIEPFQQKFHPTVEQESHLDSYQISFAQMVQNICGHHCKALTNKHLKKIRIELNFLCFYDSRLSRLVIC